MVVLGTCLGLVEAEAIGLVGADPEVAVSWDRLVWSGRDDDVVALSDADEDRGCGVGFYGDEVGFYDGEVVVVDAEDEGGGEGGVDDTEEVLFTFLEYQGVGRWYGEFGRYVVVVASDVADPV